MPRKPVFFVSGAYTATILDAKSVSEFLHSKLDNIKNIPSAQKEKIENELAKADAWLKTAEPNQDITICGNIVISYAFRSMMDAYI